MHSCPWCTSWRQDICIHGSGIRSQSCCIVPHFKAACGCTSPRILYYRLTLYACLQVLGSTRVMPSNGTEVLRGVFSMEPEADLSSGTVYLETAHPGMTFDFQTPKFYLASDLSSKSVTPNMPNVTDTYSPCAIMPEHGYTVVYEVELPQGSNSSVNLNIFMCSPGGYDQVCPAPPIHCGIGMCHLACRAVTKQRHAIGSSAHIHHSAPLLCGMIDEPIPSQPTA